MRKIPDIPFKDWTPVNSWIISSTWMWSQFCMIFFTALRWYHQDISIRAKTYPVTRSAVILTHEFMIIGIQYDCDHADSYDHA